ncbi:MAG: glycosyltransferase family 2 protein [Candidatus Doudnabacteria bacterium]|nr:glycosyltransferase family 2 protein [Candidatus Doudnabacteria bacterium]
MKIFFSVIILSFNRSKLLKRALDSVAKQTFKDYEIVIVDGGSGQTSQIVSNKHKTKPRYFKVINEGIGKVRDFGLKKAKGEWTAFLDDDDEYLPEHLQTRFAIIKKNPKLELLYNGFKTIGSQYVPDLLRPGKFLHVDDKAIFHAGTAVVKTKKAIAIGGFSKGISKYYPDNFLKVAKRAGLKTARVKKRTYIYRRFRDSYTAKFAKNYPNEIEFRQS